MDTAVRSNYFQPYTRWLSWLTGVVVLLPFLFGLGLASNGDIYLGYQYNLDDHMVYSAWIQQALEGRFLFSNRFTTDPQPGLTIHLYFLVLGWVAKIVGIPIATAIARFATTVLSVHLLARLIDKSDVSIHAKKAALTLAVVGGGVGFLVWHSFGIAIVKSPPPVLTDFLLGRLPVDVWQPEFTFFSSALTNGLFTFSFVLILLTLLAVVESKEDPKAWIRGFFAFGVLMNVHSYDSLLLFLVCLGFIAMQVVAGNMTPIWFGRIALIGAGALIPAAWFLYVLREDVVFQARAATPTFTPNFRQILGGVFLAFVGAIPFLIGIGEEASKDRKRVLAGLGLTVLAIGYLAIQAPRHDGNSYFLSGPEFWGVFLLAGAGVALMARGIPSIDFVLAWAILGLVIPYFPALFQRKLEMGLFIPWTILAGFGIHAALKKSDRSLRNLATVLAVVLFGGTSLQWLIREFGFIRDDVSNTTLHAIYLPNEVAEIRKKLLEEKNPVVIAPPGAPVAPTDEEGKPVPDRFLSPIVPDLNPVLVGFAGARGYAAHWSETPKYQEKRSELTRLFFTPLSSDEQKAIVERSGADYIVALNPDLGKDDGESNSSTLPDLSALGDVQYSGKKWLLIKVRR